MRDFFFHGGGPLISYLLLYLVSIVKILITVTFFRFLIFFLGGVSLFQDEWVVCKVFHKSNTTTTDVNKRVLPIINPGLLRMNSSNGEDLLFDFSSLPPLVDPLFDQTSNKHIDNDFKGTNNTPSSSSAKLPSSSGYYLPNFNNNNNNQQMLMMKPEEHKIYEIPINNYASTSQVDFTTTNNPMGISTSNNNILLSQPQIRTQNSTSVPFNMFQDCYNHTHQGKQCKMEQFSIDSTKKQPVVSASQDTCLSNDTSSVVSKQDNNMGRNKALYEDNFEGPSSVATTLSDLECLWDDY